MLQSADSQSKSFTLPLWMACLLAVAALGLTACQTPPKSSGKALEAEGFTLRYSSKFSAGEEVAAMTLQHPLPIGEDVLARHMWTLQYETNSLMGEPTHVFTRDDIMKVKRLLTKALNRASMGNVVGFTIESEEGETEGILFASDDRLYWKLEKIQGVSFNLTRNFNARYGTAWHLLPQKGQKLFVSGKLFGSKTWENWLVVKLGTERTVTKRRVKQKPVTGMKQQNPTQNPTPENTTAPAPSGNAPSLNPELEKKLEFLKSLRDRKLIGEDEYLKKQKELLDSYF
ncbi:hypothetical protein [Nitrospina watsonii]|uniref:SHOCT domain-containing protein n=1 Tax=Nitrospina watsonii TaxID=1323948 RepID=A0ABN8VV10_9BACT|nr:hypothetical protein [Nitrospina watsonii]CAI2717635.1 conserved protein of unknown function [Nitrospina watsonii]